MIDVLIPTKRWNALTRIFLTYMASVANNASVKIHLYIGDNSCDVDKHRFLKELANDQIHPFLHEEDLGAYGNMTFLMKQAKSPYVQLFGDDDWVHPDWYQNISHFETTPEISGVTGPFLHYPSGSRQVSDPGNRFMNPDAVERSLDYVYFMLNEVAANTYCFAIRRLEDFQIFHSFLTKHPCTYQFHDQLLSQISLLRGPMISVDNGLVVYNTKFDATSSAVSSNQQKLLLDSGLPEWFGELHFYLIGVEYATIYQFHDLTDEVFQHRNRNQAADHIYQVFLNSYNPSPEVIGLLQSHDLYQHIEKAREIGTAEQGVIGMHQIISKLNPVLGEKYAHFINTFTNFAV